MYEINPTPKRVVIYARVSTEHEAQINALENQLDWYKPILEIDSLKDEIEALMPKKEDTVTNYSEKMEMLRFALSQYNAPEYFENGIPESVIDAYVEKIVVFEDHFEWYLRFGGNDPLKCHVNGKEDANPEVILGDSSSSLTELEKHRLLLAKSANQQLANNATSYDGGSYAGGRSSRRDEGGSL